MEKQNLFAEVIIPLALPRNYTWAVPPHLREKILPGVSVEVELRNKKYSGIVKKLVFTKPSGFEPKNLLGIIEEEPLIFPPQLSFWSWIADYYLCSEGEVMQAAVPAYLKLSGESVLILTPGFSEPPDNLDDEEYIITEALSIKKELRMREVQQLLGTRQVYPVMKKLIAKNICYVWESLRDRYREKTETYIRLSPVYEQENELAGLLNNWAKAPRQLELLLSYLHLLRTEGAVTQSALLKKSNASAAQLKGLLDKKILFSEKKAVNRLPLIPGTTQLDFTLSDRQQAALDKLHAHFQESQVCLLHGITSSGKTHIYIRLIEENIRLGKQVLYMLPEIALTAQIIRRLQLYFEGKIAIYHSKFNSNERVEIWNKVKSGEIKAVLGARSSLFLPFRDLGLIIIDEEHDASYKQQDPAPRYHARDAAIYYATLFQAKVLLGSATPSIESYFNCQSGKYGYVHLEERFGKVSLPEIKIVDTKKNMLVQKEKVAISPELADAIKAALEQERQIILFQNRRGYAPYMICTVCGWIPQCKNCDVTLTYHKAKNRLLCHYCGNTYPVIQTCEACGSHRFVQKNFGTEKIEEILVEQFSNARIARMDYDSIRGKHDHDNLIKQFEQHKIDILVGTQMVVKGLDFENVGLVGVLDADGILNFTDFRVNERAFQLMEQVSGRAGRKDGKGEVLIQVSNTKHPVLKFVQDHNYRELYDFEIGNRRQYGYPPFTRIIHLVFRHRQAFRAEEAANIVAQGLQKHFEKYLSGPAEPVVNRIRNLYLWELLIKLPKDAALIHRCKTEILQQMQIVQTNKNYRGVTIHADIDPV